MDGEVAVLLRRLDAMKLAIRSRNWTDVEFTFDQVSSTAQRIAGTRDRLSDAARRLADQPLDTIE